jgi:ADP-dependent NAD(P)H-hydrate dehydratase / NAD(P)H-hydrate epimerase
LRPLARVVNGPEAAAIDAATIAAGVPSRALMQRAGAAAAAEITQRYPGLLSRGVLVLAGPGNNGGDGWVIARALADMRIPVGVLSPDPPRSPDCIAESRLAASVVQRPASYSGEGIVIDALIGTGASGALRGAMGEMPALVSLARARGAAVVAIDLPSGLDATTGASDGAIPGDLTLTFGAVKRGHLVARGICGEIVTLDIGLLSVIPSQAGDLHLADSGWVRSALPGIAAESHKGARKKLVFHGGAPGMAGAVILGLRAALASGIGMVKARVHPDTVNAVHGAVPATLIEPWSSDDLPDQWADVLVIGPGLGQGIAARRAVERAMKRHAGPVVLDADALSAFAGDAAALRPLVGNRPVLLTPHPVEFARLLDVPPATVLDRRFDIGGDLASVTGATVLLKGVPTVITAPGGRRIGVAEGTPTLATGGSGDLLSGIAGTLLAQMADPLEAAACAAFVHGRAARLAGAFVRGTTLDDVLQMLPNAWRFDVTPPRYPVIAELPAIPSR